MTIIEKPIFSIKPISSVFKYEARELCPTQISLGLREVLDKQKKMEKMNKEERHLYLKMKPVPVVHGFNNNFYVVDHHHLGRAVLENKNDHVYCYIIADFTDLSLHSFWIKMNERKWVYPYNEHGKEETFSSIPAKLMDLKDDPFRSLASTVKRAGGYIKSETPYEEFAWANFFRKKIDKKLLEQNYDKASKEALAFARSPDARMLPGYITT